MNRILPTVFLLFLLPLLTYSQGADTYNFSASTRTYSALTGTTPSFTNDNDDEAISSAINLPFSFTFGTTAYTQIKVSSNGWLTFGGTSNAFYINNSTNASSAKPILFPLWDDLKNTISTRYVTTGVAPNRIFKLEWSQQRWDYNSAPDVISFQVWLYETTNVIEYLYNQGTKSVSSGSASIGIYDANDKYLTLNNSGASPTAQSSTFTTNINTKPQNGQVYTWTPCTPSVYAMTGTGGNFCSTAAGSPIGLANSETGVSYQLLKGTVAVGSAVAGTGSAISFGTFNATGTYTVLATRNVGSCTSTMSGSVAVLNYSTPPTPTATATNVSCPTDATGTITVTNAAAPASLAFLSASNQYIDFNAKMLSNRAAFTVEGWIKFDPANYTSRMSLFGQNDVIEIAFENNSLRCWTYNGGSVDLPLASFPAGNAWHHIAVTGDGTTGGLKIYLDGGTPVTGGSATSNYGSDTNYTTKIGWGIMDPGGIGLTGEVFKLGFWNRALTATEITNLSSGFVTYDASQSGLLAGYSFNEGSGTTVSGVGSVAPTGTFVNSPVWTDPYVYSWTSTPAGFTSSLKNITGLTARTYNLTTSLKGCTNSGSWVVNATNTAPTITTIGTAQAVCYSAGAQTTSLTYTATSSAPTSYSIVWNAAANAAGLTNQANTAFAFLAGGGSLNTIAITAGTTSGTYTGTMTITNGNGCTATQAVTVTVNAIVTAGTIGTAQTICNGVTPAALTSSTAGTGSGTITYEWQTNASGSYVTIGGATSATYSPPALTATTSYQRRTVSVSGGTTCYSAYTTPVTITVNAAVTAGTIAADQTICNGATPAALTSSAAGTGSGTITYEWQTNASGSYVTIGGATSATYSPPALTTTTSYQRRTVSVSGGTTCYSVYTTPVTITVNAAVTAGTIAADQTICNGATPAALTSSTAGTGSGTITYEWQTNASGSYVTIGGATSATYSPPALTTTTSYQRRTVSVSGGTTCYSVYTTPVTITVNAAVTAGTIAANQTICNGTTPAALTSSTAGTGSGTITYEWQTNASGSYVTIGGATSATYSPPALTTTTSYQRRTVSVSGGTTCYSVYTTPVTITVNAAVTAGTISADQTICNGATPAALTSSTAGTGSGTITYEWQTNASGSYVTIGGATSATYSPPALTATTSYQRRTVSVSGGTTCYSAYTTPVTITVNAAVTAGTIAADQTICNGATPAALTSSTAGTGSGTITYEWQTNASGSYVTIGGATSASYSPPALTATTSYQRRTVSVSGGTTCYSAYTTPVTITVNAAVTAGTIAADQTICNGATPAVLTSSTAGTGSGTITYEWQTNASGSYVTIGGATSATYSPPALTATTSYQRRTVSVSGGTTCYSAYTTPVTITVNAAVTAGIIAADQTICNGATPAALTSSTAGTGSGTITYEWQTNASGSYVTIGGATSATYSPPALTATTSYQRRTVSVSGGTTCYSVYTTPVTVTVSPLPAAPTASATTQPTCVVPTGTITVTAPTGAGITYSVDGIDYTNTTGVFNVMPGTYSVTMKNASGCISAGTSSIVINSPTTNTWDGTKWSKTGDTTPPTVTDIVVFNGDFTITTQLNACSCQVNPGVKVVVGVAGGANDTAILKVVNGLNVDPTSTLTFENNASLVQVNDAAVNTGTIIYKRKAKPMKNFDYTYWSSPVVGQKLNVLSPNTLSDKYLSYVNNAWKVEPGATPMKVGKGYIIRTPKDNGGTPWPNGEVVSFPYAQPVQFVGVPNNGVYSLPIGTTDGDGNLIGNPYSSAMSADDFLAANNKEIDGTIYFWTHNTAISNLMYSSTDYASYNGVGGVNTLPAGSGGSAPDGNIAAGQSFFAVTKKGAGFTGSVTFNNSMRVGVANSNAQFFKGAKTKKTEIVKHRVWLNLANDNGAFKQTLVGYVTGATPANDLAFDGESFDGNKYIDFYSINESKNLVIQGRALPFDKTDKVPLGYKTTVEGTFTISIDKVDGVLASQAVFVEDKVTNVIHNLKNGAYSFSTQKGVFNDRFVLRYVDNTPVVTDPIVKDPVVTDPVVKDPVVTDPVVKDPVVTDPVVKDPVITDPVVKDPVVTDPVVKDPVVTDPVVKDPVVTDPVIKDPVIKDPIVTTPVVTDPIALDPTKGGSTLGTDGFENKGRAVVVSVKDHQIKINSFDETIGTVMVYDLRGRLLYQKEHVNRNEYVISNLDSSDQFLIVLTQLINGKWITKEIVF
ncbi:T9SS sorting signal type C domain-containing protein [Flavobacterium aestivum]|uniref:T9SS sorting signal type C domain-containing protein n=1 Tax=Flavobacterium aestivum TaxID=3003257 RepID=UPI0024830E95|nr:T9SS sorting signal type C domain-containing protein [Flavobacterium aestivum]